MLYKLFLKYSENNFHFIICFVCGTTSGEIEAVRRGFLTWFSTHIVEFLRLTKQTSVFKVMKIPTI